MFMTIPLKRILRVVFFSSVIFLICFSSLHANPVTIVGVPKSAKVLLFKSVTWWFTAFAIIAIEAWVLKRFLKSTWILALIMSFVMNFISTIPGVIISTFNPDDINVSLMMFFYVFPIFLVLWLLYKPPRFFISAAILTAAAGCLVFLYSQLILNDAQRGEMQKYLDLPVLLIGFSLSIMIEAMTIILCFKRRDIWKPMILCNIYSYILLAMIFPFLVLTPFYNQDDVAKKNRQMTMSNISPSPGAIE